MRICCLALALICFIPAAGHAAVNNQTDLASKQGKQERDPQPAAARPASTRLSLPVPKASARPDAAAMLRRAEKGDVEAWVALSELHYMAGREYKALESADKAAKLDRPAGHARAAFMRYVRADTEAKRDSAVGELQRAWKPLRKAADAGDAPAMNVLGELYQNGLQTLADPPLLQSVFGKRSAPEPNMPEALNWFRKSADSGNALGKALLGRLYFSGRGVKEDTASALRLFAEADPVDGPVFGLTPLAEEGEMSAAMALGELYGHRGEMEKSLQWVRKAAEAGDPEALFYLGYFYRLAAGGVKGDDANELFAGANKLFRKAADGSYADAWLYLALDAAHGRGLEKNFRQARAYLDSARSDGFDSRKADVVLAAIGRLEVEEAEEKQRQAEAERKRAEKERERAEEERQRAEVERQRQWEKAHVCDHVYVGKTFEVETSHWAGFVRGLRIYEVMGFSANTQRVTLRDNRGNTPQEVSCSQVPR
jgi:TPR repeat protein